MHPMVALAISRQDRARHAREDRIIWRNASAARASRLAVERDERWASAIARRSRADDSSCVTA